MPLADGQPAQLCLVVCVSHVGPDLYRLSSTGIKSMSSTYSTAGSIPEILTWNVGNILLRFADTKKQQHVAGDACKEQEGEPRLLSPSRFGDDHLGAQLVELLPQRLHLQLNPDPAHWRGLDAQQRPPIGAAG